jgi:outer membrane receptor protein involved in Fe transport
VSGGYVYEQARVTEFAANPALVNNCNGQVGESCFLAQVPKHRGSVRAVYAHPRYATVSVGILLIGRQFDDDQNARIVPGNAEPGLPGYATVDLAVSRRVAPNVDVFFGAQNLFDQEYFVGTQPTTIGSPRLVHGGVRVRWMGR